MTDKEFTLNVGGKYLIKIPDQDDTVGIFKGYPMLGNETSVAIEMDGGKMRFIPISQIVFIDVLEPGEAEKSKPAKNRDIYYG